MARGVVVGSGTTGLAAIGNRAEKCEGQTKKIGAGTVVVVRVRAIEPALILAVVVVAPKFVDSQSIVVEMNAIDIVDSVAPARGIEESDSTAAVVPLDSAIASGVVDCKEERAKGHFDQRFVGDAADCRVAC